MVCKSTPKYAKRNISFYSSCEQCKKFYYCSSPHRPHELTRTFSKEHATPFKNMYFPYICTCAAMEFSPVAMGLFSKPFMPILLLSSLFWGSEFNLWPYTIKWGARCHFQSSPQNLFIPRQMHKGKKSAESLGSFCAVMKFFSAGFLRCCKLSFHSEPLLHLHGISKMILRQCVRTKKKIPQLLIKFSC